MKSAFIACQDMSWSVFTRRAQRFFLWTLQLLYAMSSNRIDEQHVQDDMLTGTPRMTRVVIHMMGRLRFRKHRHSLWAFCLLYLMLSANSDYIVWTLFTIRLCSQYITLKFLPLPLPQWPILTYMIL